MDDPPIYLDYAATTPVLPEVADAVRDAMLAVAGNASSQHAAGRAAPLSRAEAVRVVTPSAGLLRPRRRAIAAHHHLRDAERS